MKRKIIAFILTLVLLFSLGSTNIFASAQNTPTVTLESVEAAPGDNVSVKVSINNNPGIWGMDLKIAYDKSALTLVSVDNGDFYEASEWVEGDLNGDIYILSYEANALENITTPSGTLATLNFKVSDNADYKDYAITASYNTGDIINVSFDEINPSVTQGKITIKESVATEFLPGDIDNNGVVDLTDVVALAQYVAKWKVTVNVPALDPDEDGFVSLTDVVILAQYVARWDVTLSDKEYIMPNK